MKKIREKGFTLVELLVVITISVLLLGLLLIPIIKTLETNPIGTGPFIFKSHYTGRFVKN